MDLDHPRHVLDPAATDPHGEGRRLRALGPCVPVELPQGVPAWITTDDATARTALAHPGLVKDARHWRAFREGGIRQDWPLIALAVGQTMLNRDGADHARLRGPVGRAFGLRPVRSYAPRITRLTDALLDGLAAQPPDAVTDLKARFARPLPIAVICDMLGIDDPQVRERFGRDTSALLSSTATPQEIGAAHGRTMDLLEEVSAAKERTPGDDLTTRLVEAHLAGELDRTELLDSLLLLVVAGHDTTVNLITNAVRAVLAHPEQLALIRDGVHGWPDVIEETLRHDPPVQRVFFRFARQDVLLGGVLVREGEPVVVGLAGAGRDEELYRDADRFDITRARPVPTLTFGHGPHYCLGAPLARLEAQIALPALFARFPDLTPAARPAPRFPSQAMNGVAALPVHLGPAAR